MVYPTHQISPPTRELCNFLRNELELSDNELNLGIRQAKLENAPLPIVLWSFGLITLDQFILIDKWIARSNT